MTAQISGQNSRPRAPRAAGCRSWFPRLGRYASLYSWTRLGPHQRNIGCRELSTMPAVVRRLCDQELTGPRAEPAQSKARHRARISPDPAKSTSASASARWLISRLEEVEKTAVVASPRTSFHAGMRHGQHERAGCQRSSLLTGGSYRKMRTAPAWIDAAPAPGLRVSCDGAVVMMAFISTAFVVA